TPTAIMVGSGLGANRGILFKTATALEASAKLDAVVFDKTGTLTRGEPEVTDVILTIPPDVHRVAPTSPPSDGHGSAPPGLTEDTLLTLVAAVERESEHPLAQAVVRYAENHDAQV